ncbi:uncharacterized protein LOC116846827 isoform X2 [Odontomachus brunneus]|uniref:uncharacterized protein LOC116846827 isoform X2 n=1 Tax=Odontomachus brunneus TaxID=486640 RepID=UPI0013F29696|nr:uncharacterized protein LOC116846827 isoform X2 [Odontomachus brunneus]
MEKLFPLKTTAQLLEVEKMLKENFQDASAIFIGGSNVDDAVKRTLCKIFSNELAEKYNWEGRCGKEPLQNLRIMRVIFKFVLQNVTDSDQGRIHRRIMEWFRHSKERYKNEGKRCARGHREANMNTNT